MCASQLPGQRSDGIHVPNDQKTIISQGADLAHTLCKVIVCMDVDDRVLEGCQQLAVDRRRRPAHVFLNSALRKAANAPVFRRPTFLWLLQVA